MKLLYGYTLDYLKKNRRNSVAIMVAILMTATMLSALCGFMYNVYEHSLSSLLIETGNWHGELFDDTKGSMLPTIKTFDSVEEIMIKGDWKVAKIDDPRRDYLIFRDASVEYLDSMPEGSKSILEGRVPQKPGEIALSKQYFENHKELKIGDTLTLPLGSRVDSKGDMIAPPDVLKEGETFVKEKDTKFTVVGKIDFTTSSTVPAYTAMGFLDPKSILPEDDLTIYLRFHNIKDTYKELPKIAKAVGYQQDEYGNYVLKYNTPYLAKKGVFAPEQSKMLYLLAAGQGVLSYLVIGLLVVGLFVLVIHNAFELSASSRLMQLGIFASVGASPKQIKSSMVLEALLLTVIPLPLGIIIGQFFVGLFIHYANIVGAFNKVDGIVYNMEFVVSYISILPSVLLTLLTVWWSASIPARKIAKMSPIAAIRQNDMAKLKKQGRFSLANLGKIFGLPGELAATAIHARKRSYRTSTISLILSFLVLASFLCINSASTASKAVYQTDEKMWEKQDILLTLNNVAKQEDYDIVTNKIKNMEEIKDARWYRTINAAVWLKEEEFSDKFWEKGGFKALEKYISNDQIPLKRDGKRRVGVRIIGLDDKSFSDYCKKVKTEPQIYYDKENPRSILYQTVSDITTSTKRYPVLIPFLNMKEKELMELTEKMKDSSEGNYTYDVEVACITEELPLIGEIRGKRYSLVQIMPMSQVENIAEHYTRGNIVQVNGVIEVTEPRMISSMSNKVGEICDSYFGSGDYEVLDEDEYFESMEIGNNMLGTIFAFISGLLAVIGLSNAWSTVRGTLNARRREFAMLRSVGLPPKGITSMLWLEAVMLGLTPILCSFPLVLILQSVFLYINEITFLEWLPFAPIPTLLFYIAAVLLVILAAYTVGRRNLLKENIVEAIKTVTI